MERWNGLKLIIISPALGPAISITEITSWEKGQGGKSVVEGKQKHEVQVRENGTGKRSSRGIK